MIRSRSAFAGSVYLLLTAGAVSAIELGDPAPPLQVAGWVKGKPVNLKAGKGKQVYGVEFWATWCGPCKASIPHLTERQKKYADKGVVIIGVSHEEASVVKPFVEKMGDKMEYTVAVDRDKATYNAYMKAFGQGGIPHAFVIDKEGRIVWHGHPERNLEETIEQILAGKYDLKAARQAELSRKMPAEYFGLIKAAEKSASVNQRRDTLRRARVIGLTLVRNGAKDADLMDDFASKILALEDPVVRDLDLAGKAAKAAVDASGETDAEIIQTYARVLFESRRRLEAVKYQKKAIELSKDEDDKRLEEMKATLAKYEKKESAAK